MTEKKCFIREKTYAPDFKRIKCKNYDNYKDFVIEPSGFYVLIKVNTDCISLAVCNKDHVIIREFLGKTCQDIYFNLFKYEADNSLKWFTRKDHIAYIGKELKKAEIALATGSDYVQE